MVRLDIPPSPPVPKYLQIPLISMETNTGFGSLMPTVLVSDVQVRKASWNSVVALFMTYFKKGFVIPLAKWTLDSQTHHYCPNIRFYSVSAGLATTASSCVQETFFSKLCNSSNRKPATMQGWPRQIEEVMFVWICVPKACPSCVCSKTCRSVTRSASHEKVLIVSDRIRISFGWISKDSFQGKLSGWTGGNLVSQAVICLETYLISSQP